MAKRRKARRRNPSRGYTYGGPGEPRVVASWESRGGAHWVDLYEYSDGAFGYSTDGGGGVLENDLSLGEAVQKIEGMLSYLAPDKLKKGLQRVSPYRKGQNPEAAKSKIPWVAVAAGVIGILWLRSWKNVPLNKVPWGARVEYAMKPIEGKANQLASIQTYRLIANRRSGMTYAPVTEEKEDKTLIFTVPVNGTVTRNVVVDGSKKYVEIATA